MLNLTALKFKFWTSDFDESKFAFGFSESETFSRESRSHTGSAEFTDKVHIVSTCPLN